jgi:hypothetical protein
VNNPMHRLSLVITLMAILVISANTAYSQSVVVITGPEKACNSYHTSDPSKPAWEQTFVHARCPAGTVLVGGGCEFECLNQFEHTTSIPVSNNRWRCGIISDDGSRTYNAKAVCLVRR